MGLDVSHDAWHGAYGAFTRWRNTLAEVAGYSVAKVTWPDVGYPMDTVLIDWGHIPEEALYGDWDGNEPDDALLYLIAHSDCEGELRPEAAARLADRLESLLPDLPTEPGSGHIGDWREKTQKFIDGCREAAKSGEPLDFY